MSTLRPTRAQAAWRRSARLPDIGREALAEVNARRVDAPVCGAKVKKTSGVCQQPALENGRCRFHGGLTPKGDAWHKPRWPAKDGPRFEQKLNRKIADLAKRKAAQEAHVAAMTPEERAKYKDWHRRHRPGSAAARAAARAEAKSNRVTREFLQRPASREMSAEARRLARTIEKLERLGERQNVDLAFLKHRDDLGIFA